MTHEPNASLLDAAALVAGLFVARHALLLLAGDRPWARWTATWLRRGASVGALIPALRLATLAMGPAGEARAASLWFAALAILAAGALLLVLDGFAAAGYRRAR